MRLFLLFSLVVTLKEESRRTLIMADSRDLLSVGVDVGTTTTQVIFSRLNLQDVSRPGQIPRINITDRKVVYQSPIVFTPLLDFETIDADKLNGIVRR